MEESQEKEKVREVMKRISSANVNYNKRENFQRAISFAMDEVNQLEEELQKFISSINHLVIYDEMFKTVLSKDFAKLIESVKYLIQKNYSKEEKEKMPHEVLRQVEASQKQRLKILKEVAKCYFHHK